MKKKNKILLPGIFVLGAMLLMFSFVVTGTHAASADAASAADKDGVKRANPEGSDTIKLQSTCPVTGREIDRTQYVDHEGKRIYVCGPECLKTVGKDPAAYITQLESEGITVARYQTTCPVMGGTINKSLYVDHEGKRIYVCCQQCLPALQKDPMKYIEKLESQGIILDSADKPVEMERKGDHSQSDSHSSHKH